MRHPHGIDFIIAANLKKARLQHKMSQSQAAKHLGVSYQQLQKYENATNRISAASLWDLAKLYQIQIQEFFEG